MTYKNQILFSHTIVEIYGGIPLNIGLGKVRYGWAFNPTKKLKLAMTGNLVD